MSDQQLTIAVIGAGGKMGMRVSNNLQRSSHTVLYAENSPAGRQRTTDAGRAVTDPSGYVALKGLSAGGYELVVDAPGYSSASRNRRSSSSRPPWMDASR